MSELNQVVRTWLQQKLKDGGLALTESSIEEMSKDLQKRYESRMKSTQKSLDTPPESTRPATVEGAVQAQDALIDGERKRFGLEKDRGKFLLESRGEQGIQDVKRYGGIMDANTRHATTILDAFGGQKNDQRNFYGDTHIRNIDYLSGRDDKILNLAQQEVDLQGRQVDLQSQQMALDFIARLVGTGAILYG